MVATQAVAAGLSAVVGPAFLGGFIQQIPGGALGFAAVGALAIWFGSRMEGIAKGIIVGLGAGILATALLSFVTTNGVSA